MELVESTRGLSRRELAIREDLHIELLRSQGFNVVNLTNREWRRKMLLDRHEERKDQRKKWSAAGGAASRNRPRESYQQAARKAWEKRKERYGPRGLIN